MYNLQIIYCLLILLPSLLVVPNVSRAEQLNAATADWSPFAMNGKNGELEGISVDIFNEIMIRTQHRAALTLLPPKRLNRLFDQNKIDINFADSPKWNPKEADLKYTFSDPYTFVSEYIYFLKENYQIVDKPTDLTGKVLGINFGYYYEQFETLFSQNIIRVSSSHSPLQLLLKLNRNKIDAALFDDMSFNYLLDKEQLDKSKFKRGKKITQAPLCLKLRIDRQYLLKAINKVISNMQQDGTIKRIISSYSDTNAS